MANPPGLGRISSTNMASSNAQSWLEELKNQLHQQGKEKDDGEEEENSLTIGNKKMRMVYMVPQHMRAAQPQAFGPETVCIGPYHAWQSDFHQTERWKLHAVQDFMTRRGFNVSDFEHHLVQPLLKEMLPVLRGCYDRYLRCHDLELAWLMAMDGIFLLQTLDSLFHDKNPSASKQALLRDMVKLENQLPLSLLQYLNRQGYPHDHKVDVNAEADGRLAEILTEACKQLSPFVYGTRRTKAIDMDRSGHLLNVLYNAIVHLPGLMSHNATSSFGSASNTSKSPQVSREDAEQVKKAFGHQLPALLGSLAKAPILKKILPVLGSAIKSICAMVDFAKAEKSSRKMIEEEENDEEVAVPPAAQELAVPSVSELLAAGVKLRSINGGLDKIQFREESRGRATLQLPVVKMDAMSDVVIRNLVALEACAASAGCMPLTRYIDFFNGIIDTAGDVQVLRECGVIQQRKQNDLQVANLWNGIGACARLPEALLLDRLINDVNAFYARRWRVRVLSLLDNYVFAGWRFLTLAAAVFLLLLTLVNTFCTAFNCSRWLDPTSLASGEGSE